MADVIVRLTGGLGNQMFQYAAGFSLARSSERKLLLEDSTLRFGDSSRRFYLGLFGLKPCDQSVLPWRARIAIRVIPSRRLIRRAVLPLLRLGIPPLFCVFDPERGYCPDVLPPTGHVILSGYWQSWKYFREVEDEIRYTFHFSPALSPESQDLLKRIEAEESIAVHVRRGDYVNLSHVYQVCDQGYYERAINLLSGVLCKPSFFIFTNDRNWVLSNLCLPGPMTLVSSRENGYSDWEDMYLMSRCRHLVIANSSFSWWAAWLAGASVTSVTAPRKWFRREDRAFLTDLLPAQWLLA